MRDDHPHDREDHDDPDEDELQAHRWRANGHAAWETDPYSIGEEDEPQTVGAGATSGRWVSRGGVLIWEEPAGAAGQTSSEAESRWAADELELPPGAPAGVRIRAVRAWLLARRQSENEAIGMLLLEQRRAQPAAEETRVTRRGPLEESPLELALFEHQAAADEYERLFETLADLETHNGPQRLLVEFYLAVSDRLAQLANAPEAPADFAPELRTETPAGPAGQRPSVPTRRAAAEWQGRASAVTQTRRRIERVSAPEIEE